MIDMKGQWYVHITHGGSFCRSYHVDQVEDLFAGSGTEIWAPHSKPDRETFGGRVKGDSIEAVMVRDDDKFGGTYVCTLQGDKIVGELKTAGGGSQKCYWSRTQSEG